ncbi:MAG: VOC family protein [Acidimicrobiales bacterium]|nr:VOC family protein [Acidimicrobiales bacterium]
MTFIPYLNFAGNCREAFERYREIFGGQLDLLTFEDMPGGAGEVPPDQAALVMHARLVCGDAILMGSDDPSSDGTTARCAWINWFTTDGAEAERVFAELSEAGEITMPLAETFWSPRFGMCVDRFGVGWMVNVLPPAD